MENRFSKVTENDHAGIIWVVSLLCLVYTVLTLVTRSVIKWHMVGSDDFALLAAQALALGQYGALFYSLRNGLGRTSEMLIPQSRISAFASEVLIVLALALSKCSVILLVRRVFSRDMKHFWTICNVILGFCCIWGVASAILVSAGCDASKYMPPQGNETCRGFAARWDIVVALDVFLELVMFVLPIYFLWGLQMAIDLKARVVLAFAFRLPLVVFTIIFLRHFTTAHRDSNPGVSVSTAIAWQQIAVAYSLISATIPCLKSFIQSFDTNFGMGDGSTEGQYNYSSGNSHSNSNSNTRSTQSHSGFKSRSRSAPHTSPEDIKMNSLRPRLSTSFRKEQEAAEGSPKSTHHIGKLRPEKIKNSTTIRGGGDGELERPRSSGSGSSHTGSQELIIRRDVQFEVRSDYALGTERV
ncbi:hypothetical protein BCR34DRAFT_472648 [Clohesyomyces aquaticus]|uniref:Rhodopsin domain-containing protein n=1 Tax=Clohesyomyces aquaticus TaxID=1231657 RepID=A0A1Y2A9N8_9PLEO|nr:hypothetical protein BCR34DRAFT_472648 [Clohesyomyces aquaticus]